MVTSAWARVWAAVALCALVLAPALAQQNQTNASDVAGLTELYSSLHLSVPAGDPCGQATCSPMEVQAVSCNWHGLMCKDWRVVAARLPGMGLTGTLPASLTLDRLQALDVSVNKLHGTLPREWATSGGLPQLQAIKLSANQLTGSLPAEWAALNLTGISVERNQLAGTLPTDWGGMRSLVTLDVSYNGGITGTLPPSWGNLHGVQQIGLASLAVGGTIPPAWLGMFNLRLLNLRDNCGICGLLPCRETQARASFPFGIVGQTVIVLAVLLCLFTACLWRRCLLFRRYGEPSQRSGVGLVRATLTLRRTPRRPESQHVRRPRRHGGAESESDEELEAVGPSHLPIVIVQPGGAEVCTAKLDSEFLEALHAAGIQPEELLAKLGAGGGARRQRERQQPDLEHQQGAGQPADHPTAGGSDPTAEGEEEDASWASWLRGRWLGGAADAGGAGAAAGQAPSAGGDGTGARERDIEMSMAAVDSPRAEGLAREATTPPNLAALPRAPPEQLQPEPASPHAAPAAQQEQDALGGAGPSRSGSGSSQQGARPSHASAQWSCSRPASHSAQAGLGPGESTLSASGVLREMHSPAQLAGPASEEAEGRPPLQARPSSLAVAAAAAERVAAELELEVRRMSSRRRRSQRGPAPIYDVDLTLDLDLEQGADSSADSAPAPRP
eukprot:scaffold15.g4274.t1